MFKNFFNVKSFSKTPKEIAKVKEASRIVALVHEELKKEIKPGSIPLELDAIAKKIIEENGGKPAFLDYDGFPNSICLSINETLVHGIPNNNPLHEGDIVSIDVGVEKDGYYGDAAFSMGVGKISEKNQKLLDITKEALAIAIAFAKPGVKLSELGKEVQEYVEANELHVVKDFVGHGIGKELHEEPNVPNFFDKRNNFVLQENMTICIEPMVMFETDQVFIDPLDKWSVRNSKGKNTSHEEHTVLITKEGAKILSKV